MPLLRSLCPLVVVGLGINSSCRVTDETSPIPSAELSLAASKVAIAGIAVAVGPQGVSFFDNFVPCPRRGVIDYRNITGGRRATFSGCDLGDGVVVDGSVDITWTSNNVEPSAITALSVRSGLRARVSGASEASIDPVDVTAISYGAGPATNGFALLDRLNTATLQLTSRGSSFSLDTRATPANVFRPTITPSTLPNAANTLDALEERDLKRIAYHHLMLVSSGLFNETLEIQRGEHTHTTSCGTMRVTPDLSRNLPRLSFDWSDCDLSGGSFIGGRFTAEWSDFDARTGHLRMVLDGTIAIGGGVPRTTFTRIEWDISGISGFPTTARISGRLVTATGERRFDFTVEVDD